MIARAANAALHPVLTMNKRFRSLRCLEPLTLPRRIGHALKGNGERVRGEYGWEDALPTVTLPRRSVPAE